MSENKCETCKYFRQHYIFFEHKIFRVYCGHCIHPKVKKKKPDSKICDNYVKATSTEKDFVTKEYLSKALLEYVLNLELLPEIFDAEVNLKDKIL